MGKLKRMLTVTLTDEQIKTYGEELAEENLALEVLEAEKKEEMDSFKNKIQAKKTNINRLANIVNDGEETLEVECEWQFNVPEKGKKRLIRLDTNETVQENEMTQWDWDEYHASLQTVMELPPPENEAIETLEPDFEIVE